MLQIVQLKLGRNSNTTDFVNDAPNFSGSEIFRAVNITERINL